MMRRSFGIRRKKESVAEEYNSQYNYPPADDGKEVATFYKTRSSADADNRLDAFSGQSRSTNMVPFHMLHIVSYCAIL